jgi:hypothetical protein
MAISKKKAVKDEGGKIATLQTCPTDRTEDVVVFRVVKRHVFNVRYRSEAWASAREVK